MVIELRPHDPDSTPSLSLNVSGLVTVDTYIPSPFAANVRVFLGEALLYETTSFHEEHEWDTSTVEDGTYTLRGVLHYWGGEDATADELTVVVRNQGLMPLGVERGDHELFFFDNAQVAPGMGNRGEGCYVPAYLSRKDTYFFSRVLALAPERPCTTPSSAGTTPGDPALSKLVRLDVELPDVLGSPGVLLDGSAIAPLCSSSGTGEGAAGSGVLRFTFVLNTLRLADGAHTIEAKAGAPASGSAPGSAPSSDSVTITTRNAPHQFCGVHGADHQADFLDSLVPRWAATADRLALPQATLGLMSVPPTGVYRFSTQTGISECAAFAELYQSLVSGAAWRELGAQNLGSTTMNPDALASMSIDPTQHDLGLSRGSLGPITDVANKLAGIGRPTDPMNRQSAVIFYPKMRSFLPSEILVSKPMMFPRPVVRAAAAMMFLDMLADWAFVFSPSLRNTLYGFDRTPETKPFVVVCDGACGVQKLDVRGSQRFMFWSTGYKGECGHTGDGSGEARTAQASVDGTEALFLAARCPARQSRWQKSAETCAITEDASGKARTFHAVGMAWSAALWRAAGSPGANNHMARLKISLRKPNGRWVTATILNVNHNEATDGPIGQCDPFAAGDPAIRPSEDAAVAWTGMFRASARDFRVSHFTGFRVKLMNGAFGVAGGPGNVETGLFFEGRPFFYDDLTGDLDVAAATPAHAFSPTWVGAGEVVSFEAAVQTDQEGKIPLERLVTYSTPDGGVYQASVDFDYRWDFGDGSVAVGPAAIHAYDRPGTYAVTVTCRARYNPGDLVHVPGHWDIPRGLFEGIGDERRLAVHVEGYVGNSATGEVHVPACYWVGKMLEGNKRTFATLAAAHATPWGIQGGHYDNCAYCLGQSAR